MGKSTVLNVKIDENLKNQAREIADSIGLPLSSVVAAGLREFIRTRSVTFTDEPRLDPMVEAGIRQIEEDIAKQRNVSEAFNDANHAMAYLKNL